MDWFQFILACIVGGFFGFIGALLACIILAMAALALGFFKPTVFYVATRERPDAQ